MAALNAQLGNRFDKIIDRLESPPLDRLDQFADRSLDGFGLLGGVAAGADDFLVFLNGRRRRVANLFDRFVQSKRVVAIDPKM